MQARRAELIWQGKNLGEPPSAHLVEEPDLAHGVSGDNRIIHGDNLAALSALVEELVGQIKCVYIDPPYNTGSVFGHYSDDDNLSEWLSMIHPRLVLLRRLLSDEGVLFVQISRQVGYLKVLLDEVFGPARWLNDVVWKRRGGSANAETRLNNVTDFILCSARLDDESRQAGAARPVGPAALE
jgi:adenine-specific DNA-methyltransferase